ncbi:MAG: type II toxin-antitoxin system VapC family toxin [Verrucomicrobiota bacterium]
MLSIDTNILFYAMVENSQFHESARYFLNQHARDTEMAMSELVLVELYNLLRNDKLTGRKTSASEAAQWIQQIRSNRAWSLIENAPIMEEVWNIAAQAPFARRRIFDVRLALTLHHHGVTHFATANTKDFQGCGFEKVWNPLKNKNP